MSSVVIRSRLYVGYRDLRIYVDVPFLFYLLPSLTIAFADCTVPMSFRLAHPLIPPHPQQ
jgi:hypothetical protein